MHLSDTLIFGPLGPLLRRPLRVRLGVLLVGLVGLSCLILAGGAALVLRPAILPTPVHSFVPRLAWQTDRSDSTATAQPIQVTSYPTGALILLGRRELGHTPATLWAPPAAILTLRRAGFLDAFASADAPSLDVTLWREKPDVRLVRPPVPGAAVTAADFLPDGRIALAVEVPPTRERQPWAYDPSRARLDRLGNAAAPGALPTTVAVAPDGVHTAVILHLDGLDGGAADQLTFEGPDRPRQPLSTVAVGERFLDVSWSPKADGVLLLSQQRVTGGTHSVIRWVGMDGNPRDLATVPGEPLAGSWVWAPDGHAVAFLVHTSVTALVTLDIATGELRNLDDLRADGLPGRGAVAPATWQPSGSLLYAAPSGGGVPGRSGSAAPALFEVAPGRVDAHRVGEVQPVWAPIVRADGVLLTLARADNDVLVLRPVDPTGHALAEQRLGVQVSGAYSARWDLTHQQLLIMRGATGGGVEILLLRFSGDGPSPGAGSATATGEAGR